MDTLLNVTLWGKDVAAVVWNKDRGATIEFYDSFANEQLNVAPLVMPREDILRGVKVFTFPTHKGKMFKGLPGLLADSLPDDFTKNELSCCGKKYGYKKWSIIQEVVTVVSKWELYAQEAGVKKEYIQQIKETLRLIY